MVALSELTNMFWGVTLDGDGKRYTQVVERSFHISMAALETSSKKVDGKTDSYVGVMIQHEKTEFLLCTLQHGRILQQPLDLNFTEGEEVTFFLNGKGVVHLTGYLVEDNLPDDMEYDEAMTSSEEEEEENEVDSSEEESQQLVKRGVTAVESDEDDEDEEEEDETSRKGKRKKKDVGTKKVAKKAKVEQPSDSDDEDEDDDDDDDLDEADLDSDDSNFLDDEAEEASDMDDTDDMDVSEDEEEIARMSGSFLQPKSKAAKKQQSGKETPKTAEKKQEKNTPGKQKQMHGAQKGKVTPGGQKQTPTSQKQQTDSETTPTTSEHDRSDTSGEKKKKKKKKKNKPGSDQATPANNQQSQSKPSTPAAGQKQTPGGATPASNQKPKGQKRVLEGGVLCEELKEGHGPAAVPGKMVQVYYTGKLENGKIFDSATGGRPFKFKLGKNEVIKGWDIGLKGMKVGGKRKLIVPAKMAYGKEKVGNIPPNSTLVFDVELKAVS